MKTQVLSRFGASTVVAFCALAAAGLTARSAEASQWYCRVVDGQDSPSTNYGRTTNWVSGASAAILWNGLAVPFYLDESGSDTIKYGVDWNFPPPTTPAWYLNALDNTNVGYPTAIQSGSTTWVAYTDGSSHVYASSSTVGPVAGTTVATAGLGESFYGIPAVAVYGSSTWVFYIASQGTQQEIHYVKYTGGSWGYDTTLYSVSGSSALDPSAVAFNGALWVFFSTSAGLKGMTFNGSRWSTSFPIDSVGGSSAAIVDTSTTPQQLRVFYSGSYDLRVATLPAGGSWSTAVVDNSADLTGAPAPVLHGGTQVYYIDQVTAKLKGASPSGSSWVSSVVDGGTSNLCGSQGGGQTSNFLIGPVSVVERSGGPHVFYGDNHRGNLREAYWY